MAKLLLRGPSRICKLTRIHQYKHNATWLKVLWMSSCASCAEECRWTPLLTLASGVGRVVTLASPSRRICSTLTPGLIMSSCEKIGTGSRAKNLSPGYEGSEAGRRIDGHLTRAFSAFGLCSYAVAQKRPTDASRASRTSPMGPVGGFWHFG